jgi:DNA-binding LytR/AlgR family response regulator
VSKTGKETVKINLHDIVAVTCEGTCLTIHYSRELKKFTFSKSLVQVEEILKNINSCIWLRIHRNSIVSLEKIEMLDKRNCKVVLQGGLKLNVSVRKLPLVNKMINEKLRIQ